MKRLTDAGSQSRESCIEASAEATRALIYKRDMPWAAPDLQLRHGTAVQTPNLGTAGARSCPDKKLHRPLDESLVNKGMQEDTKN